MKINVLLSKFLHETSKLRKRPTEPINFSGNDYVILFNRLSKLLVLLTVDLSATFDIYEPRDIRAFIIRGGD